MIYVDGELVQSLNSKRETICYIINLDSDFPITVRITEDFVLNYSTMDLEPE